MPEGDREALESLLQYIERPPVSLGRLKYLREEDRVLYSGKFNPSLGRDCELVSALEFLAMLVPHVALRHECRIFCYGAISTTLRRKFGWIGKDHDERDQTKGPGDVTVAEEDSEFVRLRQKSWAQLIAKVWLEDPSLCNSCRKPMKIISALTSPHQDAVIERILRSRGVHRSPARVSPSGLVLPYEPPDQPSPATSLRLVPAGSGRSPLQQFACSPLRQLAAHPVRGFVSARPAGLRSS